MDCGSLLDGWESAGWFYGLATQEYSTFAALMASVAAGGVFFVPESRTWWKPARRLFLAAFLSLLIATTLYGEVAGNLDCAQQAVTGSAASMLLAIGSAVLILASVGIVFDPEEAQIARTILAFTTGLIAASSLVVGVHLSRQLVLDRTVPGYAWVVLLALAAVTTVVLLQVGRESGVSALIDTIVVSVAVLTAFCFLGTAVALSVDLDQSATLALLAVLRACGAAVIVSLAVHVAQPRPEATYNWRGYL